MWKGDRVKIDSAVFIVIQDDNAAKEMWLSGRIDVYRPGLDVLKLAVAQGDPVVRTPTSRTSLLVLNQQGPLGNPELRKAIQLAVDRKAVAVEAYSDGDADVATGLVRIGWTGWSKEQLVPFDPDEARRLVSMNNPQETLRIAVWPDPVFVRIGEQVKSDLEKAGLRSEVVSQEPANFWSAIANNAADILVTLTPAQTNGALANFERFTSNSQLGWNKFGIRQPILESRCGAERERVSAVAEVVDGYRRGRTARRRPGGLLRRQKYPACVPSGRRNRRPGFLGAALTR